MTIENYNDHVRRMMVSKYDEINVLSDGPNPEDELIPRLQEYYDEIKKKKDFKYKMGVLYTDFYIVKKFNIGDFEEEEDEEVSDDIIYNVKDLNELVKLCDDDICNLYDLLVATSIFYDLDYVDKREYLKLINKTRKNVLKIFPGFLSDIIYYLNTYDKNEILQTYLEFRQLYNEEKEAKTDTVSFVAEVLIKLKDEDYYNYKFLLLEMIEDFYKYILFLLDCKIISDDNYNKLIQLIEEDLDFFVNIAANRLDLLRMILSGFLNYILLSDDSIDKINKYYEDKDIKKRYLKLVKTSEALKKINN